MPRDLLADDPPAAAAPARPPRDLLADFGEFAKGQEEKLLDTYQNARGYQAGIDYTSGVQLPGLRAGLARMDTPAEQAGWLNTNVGPGREFWGRDPGGRIVLTPKALDKLKVPHKNRPVALDATTLERGDIAEFAADQGPMLAAGMAAGAATGGLGTIPAALLTGAAAGGAKLADEGVEKLQGYQKQTGAEVLGDAAGEAVTTALPEAAVRLARPIGRLALGPYRHGQQPFNPFSKVGPIKSKIPPERIATAKEAMAEGMRPSVGTVQGKSAFLFPRLEAAANWMGITSPVDEVNRVAILKGRDKLVAEAAGTVPGAGSARGTAGDIAERAVKSGVARTEGAASAALKTEKDATKVALDEVAAKLGGKATAEEAGAAVQETIKQARSQFGKVANQKYAEWDAKFGGQPVFDTTQVKAVAKTWLDNLPSKTTTKQVPTGVLDPSGAPVMRSETASVPVTSLSPDGVSTLQGMMQVDDKMTATQMQNLRATLREAAYDPNLLPGVPKKIQRDMLHAVDDAMDTSGLGELNKWYKEGIGRFDDARILRMTRDAGKGGSIDPEKVVDFTIRPGKAAVISKVKGLTSPPVWEKVKQAHYQSLLEGATGADGQIVAARLAREVNDLGPSLDQVYGRTQAADIRKLSRELMVADGKLSPDELAGGNLADAIRGRLAAVKAQETELENNFVAAVSSKSYEPERLTGMLLKPHNKRFIESAKTMLGQDSPEWMALRQDAMRRIMDDMVIKAGPMGDYTSPAISGSVLKEALAKYGDDTISEMFGPEMSSRLQKFASQVAFVTARQKIGAGALHVGAIAMAPLRHKARIAELFGVRWLLTRPSFIKFMTEGYEAKTARRVADGLARAIAQGGVRAPWGELGANVEADLGLQPE